MALDLHLAHKEKDAGKNPPELQIEWRIHEDIFRILFEKSDTDLVANYKLLKRLLDYNSDTVFELNELSELIAELKIAESCLSQKDHVNVITGLIAVSQEAIEKKQNMYFICD